MDKVDKRNLKHFLYLFEEISWILDRSDVKLRDVQKIIRQILERVEIDNDFSNKYKSINPNKDQLIGILPNFLQDPELFKTNKDLVIFAEVIFNIKINRADKRSKYELIGLLICNIKNLNDLELTKLVKALLDISNNEYNLKKLKNKKKYDNNFSWNDAIYEISNGNNY